MQSYTEADLNTLERGRRVTRSLKISYLANDANIKRASRELSGGHRTLEEFLNNANYFVASWARAVSDDEFFAENYEVVLQADVPNAVEMLADAPQHRK